MNPAENGISNGLILKSFIVEAKLLLILYKNKHFFT